MEGLREYRTRAKKALEKILDKPTFTPKELAEVANLIIVADRKEVDLVADELDSAELYIGFYFEKNNPMFMEMARDELRHAYNLLNEEQRIMHTLTPKDVERHQFNLNRYNSINASLREATGSA